MSKQLFRAVFCATLLFGWNLGGILNGQSLIETFESGRDAFLAQDYPVALSCFQQLEREFSAEPEFQEATLQKYFLSMFGMAALLSNDPATAVAHLRAYMETYYRGRGGDALVLLGLIQAVRQLELQSELDLLYLKFLSDFPDHPDYHMIRYERMLSLFGAGRLDDGIQEMETLWSAHGPKELRYRSKLVGLQQLLDHGELDKAGTLLLSTQWDVNDMPEMAVLAITSLKLGDHFSQQEDWKSAIKAYRLVPFYRALVDTQRQRLSALQAAFDRSMKSGTFGGSQLWIAHQRNLISQVKNRLEQLEQSEDYTASFLLRYGRCYLFDSQYAEAWVIFRSLALAEGIEPTLEEQAWYHWILASHGAENWDEARELCLEFAEQYPDSELLPKTFYMLARTHQETGDFNRANQVLTELILRFPDHSDVTEWYLTRGFNLASLNENELALLDFEHAMQHPGISQAFLVKARYWKGVTLCALRDYSDAQEVFTSLMTDFPDHWMYPEFVYRLGTVYYSLRDYTVARQTLDQFLNSFPDHFYVPEARVLQGDVVMGIGELDRAIELFNSIDHSDPRLFMYAYFQVGKIYRAREQYEAMETHYRHYLEAIEFRGKARISEALYWLGWCLSQQERKSETIPLYLSALEKYGNDPKAGELIPMIQALEGFKKQQLSDGDDFEWEGTGKYTRQFLDALSFDDWLVALMEQSQKDQALTLYARLQLYEALKLRRSGKEDLARSAIQSISLKTPTEALDDQLLGEIGLSLAEDGFDASIDYFKRILLVYPNSPLKSLSYYGLATMSAHRKQWEDALKWLSQLERETPNHSRLFDAQLLKGEVLTALARSEEASICFNELLRLKKARGIPHVKALTGLARLHESMGEPERAIPYYQRIYTLYRAYREYVATAYLESARLFEVIGDTGAAYRTLQEFLAQKDLAEFPEFPAAVRELERIELEYAPAVLRSEVPYEGETSDTGNLKDGTVNEGGGL